MSLRRSFIRCRRYVGLSFFLATTIGLLVAFLLLFSSTKSLFNHVSQLLVTTTTTTTPSPRVVLSPEQLRDISAKKQANKSGEGQGPSRAELRMQWLKERIERSSRIFEKNNKLLDLPEEIAPNYNIHVFYYAWYETPEFDGKWQHWNHEYLPNWMPNDKKTYPTGTHVPPTDIGANFYPQLGCYSSRDPTVVDAHMRMIRKAGIGVLVVSWYPPGMSDGPSKSSDVLLRTLLDAAVRHRLKIAPHIEPYIGRNPINMRLNLEYLHREYGNHAGLYKMVRGNKTLPVFYIYDSYRTPAAAWRELLGKKGNISIRNTPIDSIFLGLVVDMQHKYDIKRANFDGFYTYFGSNGFSYGSTWKNWKLLSKFASETNLIFVPSVSPGYIDTRVRPWNAATTRHRRRGSYYEVGWRTGLLVKAPVISITSFNEWHEGTQIEPAVPYGYNSFRYFDYEPDGPMFYINLTRWWVLEFTKQNQPISIAKNL